MRPLVIISILFSAGRLILPVLNYIVSLVLLAILFAAIYKVLPDRQLQWRDVVTGALVTSLLFTVGKSLIGWYIGSSAVASSYGAAGGLIVLLLWVYYSVQTWVQNLQKSMRTGTAANIISRSLTDTPHRLIFHTAYLSSKPNALSCFCGAMQRRLYAPRRRSSQSRPPQNSAPYARPRKRE